MALLNRGIICLALAGGLCAASLAAVPGGLRTADDSSKEFSDHLVSRAGPERSLTRYRFGELGVVLPSYGRESLYLAYRALHQSVDTLQAQAAATSAPDAGPPRGSGLAAWTSARLLAGALPLQSKIVTSRRWPGRAFGSYENCVDFAFQFASDTLTGLSKEHHFTSVQIASWVEAQDQVFARCPDPGAGVALAPLTELPSSQTPYARQLRDYQIASASFYDGQLAQARSQFDAIAAQKNHARRAWAAYSALRSVIRAASLDDTFLNKYVEAQATAGSQAELNQMLATPLASEATRRQTVYGEITRRSKAILDDRTLSEVAAATLAVKIRAEADYQPVVLFVDLSGELSHFDADPIVSQKLWAWGGASNAVLDGHGNDPLDITLRSKFEYYDWIRTIQGCTDNPDSPNARGHCVDEDAHALQRWSAGHDRAWLVAVMMTMRTLNGANQDAFNSALAIPDGAFEYATMRYFAVRQLRHAGRLDEARRVLAETVQHPAAGDSAANLFAQEKLALAQTPQEQLGLMLRHVGGAYGRPGYDIFGADGDELINRRQSAADLLKWANDPATPSDLQQQFAVAAWWRADLTGNASLAETAARTAGGLNSKMKSAADRYVEAPAGADRSMILLSLALGYQISPLVGSYPTSSFMTLRRANAQANWWCAFASGDDDARAQIQRIDTVNSLPTDPRLLKGEMAQLAQVGSAQDWMARLSLRFAGLHPDLPLSRSLLEVVVRSDQSGYCPSPQSTALVSQVKDTLSRLPPNK